MKTPVAPSSIIKVNLGKSQQIEDLLTVEEPLEIRLSYCLEGEMAQQSISVTMRTPGNDYELALGFLFTEGIIEHIDDIGSIRHCTSEETESMGNVVKVTLRQEVQFDTSLLNRNFFMTSSCGICGKASIESVSANIPHLTVQDIESRTLDLLNDMASRLRQEQQVFKHTGSIHAAGLFDLDGNFVMMYEDVGRHNAVDKLIGAALAKRLVPLHQYCIMVSGRAGFELVQKSLMAGIPLMGAVGAPSHLAVNLAKAHGMALAGFVKPSGYNIYHRGGLPAKTDDSPKAETKEQ